MNSLSMHTKANFYPKDQLIKQMDDFMQKSYVTFNMAGRTVTGIVTKMNSKTAYVKPITFHHGRVYRTERHEKQIKIHIKKSNMKTWPEKVRPIN